MISLIDREFRSLSPSDKGLVHGTMLAAALFLIHYVLYSTWFIEDAAITFGYARNAAFGDGFVTYPGGERVEGFSNPTWTLALTALRVVGVSPFLAAKLLGAGCGLGALALSTVWARELVEPERRHYVLIAPFLLAVQPSFVLWCASGLENPLLSLLLAGAAIRSIGEARTHAVPASALLWALAALTRPEAPLYAAVGGLVTGASILRARGLSAAVSYTSMWLALFAIPFCGWHAWRWNYFGWEFPNTYYAKIADQNDFQPFGWDKKGWNYLRGWALITGQGFLAPIYAVGQTGVFGNRGAWGSLLAGLAIVLVLPGVEWFQGLPGTPNDPEPGWLVQGRILYIAAVLVLLPLIGIGRRGDDARVLAWALCAAIGFFGLYSGGDWMQAYRWPSMAVVPMTVLLTDAIAGLGTAIATLGKPRLVQFAVGITVATPAILGVVQTTGQLTSLETSPYDVRHRVLYMQDVADKLALERPSAGEIDMGAQLWWTEFELIDLAGLLDVPIGHHNWEPQFMRDYVIQERRPDFMHVHSFWERTTHLGTLAQFTTDWVEIPAFPTGPVHQHPGNHVRRDLILRDAWDGPTHRVDFGAVTVLEGFEFEADTVAPGTAAMLRFGVRKKRPVTETRVTVFLAKDGEVVHSTDAPLLWDWIRQAEFKHKVAVTRTALHLPEDLPPGDYDLGWVAWTRGHRAKPLVPDLEPAEQPVFATHEVVFEDALTVAAEPEVAALFDARLAALQADAEDGHCEKADRAARSARSQRLGIDGDWEERVRDYDAVRAQCWATRAETSLDPNHIYWAHRLDPREPAVLEIGYALADRWEAQADVALEEDDVEAAYAALRDALIADPTRSWLRRRAEDLRDRRLKLGDYAE
ncbi:MAG: hypothetical protein KC912_08125 [Proteobacteria bacterium]|nr:hypothetical protein [Pseudomonadota bacterium]